jgi:hypothetical protein
MDHQPGPGTAGKVTTDRQADKAGSARDDERAPEPAAATWARTQLRERIQRAGAALAGSSQASDRRKGAFAQVITAALERLRQSERARPVPATPTAAREERAAPQEGPEVSIETTQDKSAEAETRLATEWMKGAATAHDLIVRQVQAGQDADTLAAKWDQALATYDDATATDAEREWHAGAEETARDMIQTWREVQQVEAEQRQAGRDARDAGRQTEADHELEAG